MAAKVFKPSATLSIPGGDVHVDSLRIDLAVDAVASATVTVSPTRSQRVSRSLASGIIASIASFQNRRLAGVTEPDATLAVQDGKGGQIEMKGFISAPILELSTASRGDQFSILGIDAILDGLDLSIYRDSAPNPAREEQPDLEPVPSSSTGDVPAMLRQLTEVLVGNFDLALANETNEAMKELMTRQHELNQTAPLTRWYDLLTNSDAVYTSWADAAAESPHLGYAMTGNTRAMLTQQSSGFWGVLNYLMSSFKMLYIPGTASSGSLYLDSERIDSEATKEIELSATQITAVDGSRKIIQPGGVCVIAPAVESARAEDNATRPTVAGQYPKPFVSGYIHQEPPPVWMVDAHGVPVLAVTEQKESNTVNLSLSAYRSRSAASAAKAKKIDGLRLSILDEYCRVTFKGLQLADSTATVNLPLDLTVPVGTRVKFKTEDGALEGFIQAVSHRISLNGGKQLDTATTLSLTHVKYGV